MKYDTHPLGRPLVAVCCYNHDEIVKKTLSRIPRHGPYDVVIIDDGSTDDTLKYIHEFPFSVLSNETNHGVGYAIKRVVRYAKDHGYKVILVMAGNSKDDPIEIEKLLEPIYSENADYVQGSRRLPGGSALKLPWFRRLMVPVHAWLMSVLTGVRCTDALNGFRAYKIDFLFSDARVNIWQNWLDRYEYESYLHYKILTLGYRFKEIPVTKSYMEFTNNKSYSHIRPVLDWWKILRPLVFLKLGWKQ